MSAGHARDVVTWHYPPPYDCYDMTGADPCQLTAEGSGFYALVEGNAVIGFRSFGSDGQVPGGAYDDTALDTGGGLRPDLIGGGLGRHAIAAGLAFGLQRYDPAAFRVTVAAFNLRALAVVRSLGFRDADNFHDLMDGRAYTVLVRASKVQPMHLDA